jgi:hypothetical protein
MQINQVGGGLGLVTDAALGSVVIHAAKKGLGLSKEKKSKKKRRKRKRGRA